jgi:4-oxalocrotonate tautomerase
VERRKPAAKDGHGARPTTKEPVMPLVDIQLIRGVFTPDQKKTMISKVTDAMVAVEGEAMRGVTWVRVQEIESGEWAIGGQPLSTQDVKAMAGT